MKVRCPDCWIKSEFKIDEIPAEVRCPQCGTKLSIQVSYVPKRKQLELAAAA